MGTGAGAEDLAHPVPGGGVRGHQTWQEAWNPPAHHRRVSACPVILIQLKFVTAESKLPGSRENYV